MDVLKIAMIGITGAFLAILLKNSKPEYSMFLSMGTCICIFVYLLTKLEMVVDYVAKIEGVLQLDENYIKLLMKMIGITYIAQFASEICKDAGYGAIGTQVEMFGKVAILFVSMPLMLALLETIGAFL